MLGKYPLFMALILLGESSESVATPHLTMKKPAWPAACTRIVSLNEKGHVIESVFFDTFLTGPQKDGSQLRPEISPEYDAYLSGHSAVMSAIYHKDCKFPAQDPEIEALIKNADHKVFKSQDLSDPRFLYLLPAYDNQEGECLFDPQSCGDIWYDGVSDDELSCFEGRTYVRCQLDCMQKIYGTKLTVQVGACK